MKNMKRLLWLPVVLVGMLLLTGCSKYKYETVDGDPLQTRIYTSISVSTTRNPASRHSSWCVPVLRTTLPRLLVWHTIWST